MKPLPSTATRARDAALSRHRKEVNFWKTSLLIVVTICFGFMITMAFRYDNPSPWSHDTPPVETKLEVITHGWYDKHQWRSYDCGEPIGVQGWRVVNE